MAATKTTIIRPQPGPQERWLSSPADIAVYGGGAGGGKSWALLVEPLRHVSNPLFGAVIFRRTAPEISAEGGLWDESFKLYGPLGAVPSVTQHLWTFPGGGAVSFGHMQYEQDLLKWHSAQIALIGFDELTTFTERQFFYMLSRNRSTCGVRPYVRATCNPDADSWVARLLAWWIDQDSGYPIPERSGVVRWFVPAKLSDNKVLERADPGYRANLLALPTVDRERLLGGNWKIRAGGKYFDRLKVTLVPSAPVGTVAVRYWDTAATKGKASANTAGVLLGRTPTGRFVVVDCSAVNGTPAERKALMRQVSASDLHRPGVRVVGTWVEQPAGFGSESVESDIRDLAGYPVQANKVGSSDGSKEERAKPLSAQWEVGNVDVVSGDWTEAFLAEMDAFPTGTRKDRADAAAGAFNKLALGGTGTPPVTADYRDTVMGGLPADVYG
jgi:predicted phage terminase large subunit-like protein